MVDYYKVLNVSSKATNAEIKSAYRRLARKFHPDLNGGTDQTSEKFNTIKQAYEVLSNPRDRAFYDRQINSKGEIHLSNDAENSYIRKMRQAAYEKRYNEIVDKMIDEDRKASIALQKTIFPIVGLLISTCFVMMFRPLIWSNSEPLGKIIVLTLFVIGVVHLISRLYKGFQSYTYEQKEIHESILEGVELAEDEISKPFPRWAAFGFLIVGLFVSGFIGYAIGNNFEMFIGSMLPNLYSPSFKPEFLFYPPIVVLVVDTMHYISSKFDF